MIKKILLIILFFYILTLLQTSFFVHFSINGNVFNIVILAVILINLFFSQEQLLGIFSAFIAGFFLDIFSENFIGFYILILLGLALFIQFVLKKYVRIPFNQRI